MLHRNYLTNLNIYLKKKPFKNQYLCGMSVVLSCVKCQVSGIFRMKNIFCTKVK